MIESLSCLRTKTIGGGDEFIRPTGGEYLERDYLEGHAMKNGAVLEAELNGLDFGTWIA